MFLEALDHHESGVSELVPFTGAIDEDDSLIELAHGGLRNVRITIANSPAQMSCARDLINRMYDWRGYGSDHELAAGPAHTTFTALMGDEVVGTISLAVDSPSGLAADKTFPIQMKAFRSRPAIRICELTKFAFDCDGSTTAILAAVFHILFLFEQRSSACTHVVIEVHPRHVRYYERMLGFQRVGIPGVNRSVGVSSQLMCLDLAEMRARIEARHCASAKMNRSLYPMFLPDDEIVRIDALLSERLAFSSQGNRHGQRQSAIGRAGEASSPLI